MSVKIDVEKILAEHNISKEEVLNWAKQHYPEFVRNFSLIAKLYLKSKGIMLPVAPPIRGEVKQISELVLGEYANIRVVVVEMLSARTYMGCPQCYRKLETEGGELAPGVPVQCPYCGETVKVEKLSWKEYLVGDASGEIVVAIPPRLSHMNVEPGMVLLLRGALQEDETFQVLQMNIVRDKEISEAPSTEVKPVEQSKVEEKPTVKEKKKAEVALEDIERAKRYIRVRAALKKPVEEVREAFAKEYPQLADAFDDILKESGVVVKDGKLDLAK